MKKWVIGTISALIIMPTLFFSRDKILNAFKAYPEVQALAEDYRDFNNEYNQAYVQQTEFIQEQRVANQRYDSNWEEQERRWSDYQEEQKRQWQILMRQFDAE